MNYYGFPNFTQKSAKTKEKENKSFTGDPRLSTNHATAHKHYSSESNDSAENSLDLVEFIPEVPGREENRGSRRSFLFRPVGASSAVMEGWGSIRALSRTHRWPRLGQRWPVAVRPRTHTDGDDGGGTLATTATD